MNLELFVAGQKSRWKLIKKLGEGDAGEVYLAESALRGKQAIIKRPRRNAYATDIIRQSAQISSEAAILKALHGISWPSQETRLCVPQVVDQSPAEEGIGERFFIVIERAPGFDLRSLSQLAHFGQAELLADMVSEEHRSFLAAIRELGAIPQALLVRCMLATIQLLQTAHNTQVWNDSNQQKGVVWNDVKPEHLYWDPGSACLTVIDWGNGQFLEADGVTKDRLYSYRNDCVQFVLEMGSFLAEANPELHASLAWPADSEPREACEETIPQLQSRLNEMLCGYLEKLRNLRNEEEALYDTARPGLKHLAQYETLQQQFVPYGEMVDPVRGLNLHARVALQLAAEKDLAAFQQVCQKTAQLAPATAEKWDLLDRIASIAQSDGDNVPASMRETFSNALSAGAADDWPTVLWSLFEWIGTRELPDWWSTVAGGIRSVYLKLSADALTPYTAVSRLFYTLQSAIIQKNEKSLPLELVSGNAPLKNDQAVADLIKTFNEEVVKKWKQCEPAPPHAGIDYDELADLMGAVEQILPGTQASLDKILSQAVNQAGIALQAWERKDFEQVRRGLRMLLPWDPDRRRLLLADRATNRASEWLVRVMQGAGKDEPFYDYLTSMELAGRNLRNQVGAASWLDMILEAFKRLRKGSSHADLIMEYPQLLKEIPWLNEYRSREMLALPRTRPLGLERDRSVADVPQVITGVVDGKLGANQAIHLVESLDTWLPEARGSSARVFSGYLRGRSGKPALYAIKIMRPDRIEYAQPLFREEVQVLTLLRDIPGVTPMVECGYLRLADGLALPGEEGQASAGKLHGQAIRYGIEEAQNFLAYMDRHLAEGWIPYLALMRRSQEHNLMIYCDAGHNHGWFLPLRESLVLAVQICDILQSAHERNVVYRDHKILHYYWDPEVHGVAMIDWNIAKRLPQGISDAERQFDLVQFGARALHHILTGRPAPGALPLGPNRPEEIETASRSYAVNWTYDDERLPNRVKDILEQTLTQGYTQFRDLRRDLVDVYQQIPDAVQDNADA